jgi:histone acetyltransferase MYST2
MFLDVKPSKSAATGKKAPVRNAGRKSKGRPTSSSGEASQPPAIEERQCPVSGCDSSGHLSGRHEKHFTQDACPLYHNKKPQVCKASFSLLPIILCL